jgi:hypothetical protein
MNAIDEGVRRELWERWMAVMWLRCPDCAATGFGLELTECLDDPEFWQRKPSPFGRTFVSTHQILYQLAGWGFDRAEKDELPTEETLERAMEEILDYGRRGDADGAEWQGDGRPHQRSCPRACRGGSRDQNQVEGTAGAVRCQVSW